MKRRGFITILGAAWPKVAWGRQSPLPIVGTLLVLVANSLAHAVEKPKSSDAIWLERIEAGCKADAKKYYSAIHFQKRRTFVMNCVNRAYR
jgi:hypothetical protein